MHAMQKFSIDMGSPVMTSKAKDKARRRRPGRPKTTGPGALIGVRAQPDFLAKIDACATRKPYRRAARKQSSTSPGSGSASRRRARDQGARRQITSGHVERA
jgi:hypothetical protein